MEDYKKIYPELSKEAPKDKIYPGAPKDGNAFRLQQSCRVLENLKKGGETLHKCQEKVQKMLQLIVKNQHIIRNSFVLSQRFWSRNGFFLCWYSSRCITWWPWSCLWSCKCYRRRSWKKCFS